MNYNFEEYVYLEYDRDYAIQRFKEYFKEHGIELRSEYYEADIDDIDMPDNMVRQLMNTDQLVLCKLRRSVFEREGGGHGWREVTSLDDSMKNRRIRSWYIPKSFFRIVPQKELESRDYFKEKRIKKLTNTNIEI